ncbi:MAG: ribonuclease HI family protein [Candidatus Magasanikbacteria bacterium]|jgi:ribonuclease HI|nr:ribonuclease HI family protein [Candidatus Magasanikbacteria bacterium]MBT4221091.1 ribonuclease HI family protein [Candidatus Magasanikbacteria bacterium]MBT4350565.1 ribonuclease HI family protein [Candidatus Magasanikbacteria bacterium]MBT4542136.1 ribonuclease HI family protein [Candidatus Magasanikbacteria bacterium]MBT6253258.1 ribonuclease HI family protein [Candidatus Magasanikbacteria bacterium]
MQSSLIIYTDGGARGNPGPAATGVVILEGETKEPVERYGEFLGKQTNNYAEYMAVISGLKRASALHAKVVTFYCDSKLVVEQLNRNWKVKEPTLQKLFMEAYNLMQGFDRVVLTHVRREKNKEADAEVNKILDAQM